MINMKRMKVISRCIICLAIVLGVFFVLPKNSSADWFHSLVIDLADADWTLVGEENGDGAAHFASPAGDVNGDGLGDVLIGALIAGEKVCPVQPNPDGTCPVLLRGRGVAYLVLGREGELEPDPLNLSQADASFLGCATDSMTARQLYTAGDVNGDGFDDFLISGWKCGENYRGKAFLFLGRPDVETWGRYYPVEMADASFLGENEEDYLGYYVATAGDVNADGYDDFLITSTSHEYDEPCPPGAAENCTTCCKSFNDSSELFNIDSNSWVTTGSLNVERMNHTAILLGNRVLVAGGQNGDSYLSSAELFDPLTGLWTLTGSLHTARASHTMTGLNNGKVLVTGGQNASGYLDSVELYDPVTHEWTGSGNLNAARSTHTATLLPDGKVLVVGGQNSSGYLATVEVFDRATGEWTATGNLNTARSNHTATLLPNGNVLVAGGQNSSGYLNTAEIFDITTGTWSDGGEMNLAHANHTATLLPNQNSLLIAGGQDASGAQDNAEFLDLVSGNWRRTGTLNSPRAYHTATLLMDGRVLVTGGQNNSGSINTVEFYSPISATWIIEYSPAMNVPRANHIAIPIQDGKLLIAGGRYCSNFGKVYLILGRPEANWGTDFNLAEADASFLGEATEDNLGRSTVGVGDVNGDGYDDFLIGSIWSDYAANNAGQNYLFLGRATMDDPGYDPSRPWWGNNFSVAQADASFTGEAAGDESGLRVAAAGDVNDDGLDDMLMQAALNDYAATEAGITYLVLGRQPADWGMHYSLANADASFVGENELDRSGRRVSSAGDANQDGFDDFLIGAPHDNEGNEYQGIIAGKTYLIYGRSAADWGLHYPLSLADVIYIGKPDIGVAGYDVAWLNDFNGDGIDDYLIGAYGGRNSENVPGEAYVLLGSATPVPIQFLANKQSITQGKPIAFTGEYWEPNGWQDLSLTKIVLEDKSGDGRGFMTRYDRTGNGLYLFDFNLNEWLGPCSPKQNIVLDNGVVQLDCQGSRVSNNENHTMRVSWSIRWLNTIGLTEKFNVKLQAVDLEGNDSNLVDLGSWPLFDKYFYLPMVTR
jgi:N-acetylneuraminic acid mutarotase